MIPYKYLNRTVAKALYHALTPDPFYKVLERNSFSNLDAAREAMFKYYDYSMAEAQEYGRLTFTPDGTAGAAIWSIPLPQEFQQKISEKKKDFIFSHLGKKSLDVYTKITVFMDRQIWDVVPTDAWYLSILGILPERQGEGLGKKVMTPVLREADEQGVVVFAESFTPKNFGFYRRLGFETAKTVDEPITESQYTVLVRSAGSEYER